MTLDEGKATEFNGVCEAPALQTQIPAAQFPQELPSVHAVARLGCNIKPDYTRAWQSSLQLVELKTRLMRGEVLDRKFWIGLLA